MNPGRAGQRRLAPPPELVLASASPRRAELLSKYGYRFRVVVPALPELIDAVGFGDPRKQAETLSHFKATQVSERLGRGVILGADTVVAAGSVIFGKPADRDDARRILETLTRTPHEVITGVTILDVPDGRRLICHDRTRVFMRRMTEDEMAGYLDSGQWQGKAGAYGVQDAADAFVERLEGSYTNVVGLPMELLARMLADMGWSAPERASAVD
jgi:septum formation protein